MYDIAIAGGGASGLVAAISAKLINSEVSVVILEALPRVGKKILATGNGRCNLTNLNASAKSYNSHDVTEVLKEYTPDRIIDFFSSIGLECFSDSESRIYPLSNMASSVLDCLRFEAERLGIEILPETKVTSVEKQNDYFVINKAVRSRKVILATGGKASKAQGSDGSGYPILKSLGHSVTPLYPGLVQLTVRENVKSLKGVRVKAEVAVVNGNDKTVDRAEGEVLFTDYGLSGIAIMDVSRSVKNSECYCNVNILPSFTVDEVCDFILRSKKRNPNLSAEDALTGIVPKKVAEFLLKSIGVRQETALAELKYQSIRSFSEKMKNCKFKITGTRGFDNAQITVGGAVLGEFDKQTLESMKIKGLYCIGELLDVDAPCGGFNLHWAWASGIAAGRSAAEI